MICLAHKSLVQQEPTLSAPLPFAYPNGVTQTTVYDDDGKVTSITGKKGATILTNFLYDYKKSDGTPTEMVYKLTDSSGDTNFKYDQLEHTKMKPLVI